MMFVTYNPNIPDTPNNPSNDQPDLKVNTNAVNQIFDIDHFSFNLAEGGRHRQVVMPIFSVVPPGTIPPSIPAGILANQGGLYTKVANGRTQLFYTNDTSTNEYQLTRANNTDFPTFALNTVEPLTVNNYGWTFLPGGLLFQYGRRALATFDGTINFPKSFSAPPFTVTASVADISTVPSPRVVIDTNSFTTTSFDYFMKGGTGNTQIYWTAIGL